jgi:hypothetical protein
MSTLGWSSESGWPRRRADERDLGRWPNEDKLRKKKCGCGAKQLDGGALTGMSAQTETTMPSKRRRSTALWQETHGKRVAGKTEQASQRQ